jgi:protein-tyrosine phosphatase
MPVPVGILFVCLGNICRSPCAQGICEQSLRRRGWQQRIIVDSCGTAAFNQGKPPDPRAVAAALRRGYDISMQRARQIDDADYSRFHYLVAMDRTNLSSIRAWAPADFNGEIELLLHYSTHSGNQQIPDPFYQAEGEFEQLITSLEYAIEPLLDYIGNKYAQGGSIT